MGDQVDRILWSIAGRVARGLSAEERTAAIGDLAELGMNGQRALFEISGLAIRRQAELWKDWRSWAGFGLATAGAVWLGQRSFLLTAWIAIRFLTWLHVGVRYESALPASADTIILMCQALALVCWSWCGGVVLGWVSRRTVWISVLALALWLAFSPATPFVGLHLIMISVMLLAAIPGAHRGARLLTWVATVAASTCVSIWTLDQWHDSVIRWSSGN